MIVKQENRFVSFLKRFWVFIVAGFLIVAIGVTLGVVAAVRDNEVIDVVNPGGEEDDPSGGGENDPSGDDENQEGDNDPDEDDNKDPKPSDPEPVVFGLPMKNATIIKDYTDSKLLYNASLEVWESHYYIDLTADDLSVYSVLDGEVTNIEYDYLTGYVITIKHADGFESVYASLADDYTVKKGDKISKGQKIGNASNLAAANLKFGDHLEFTLLKDSKKIDPNNYLDLQNK